MMASGKKLRENSLIQYESTFTLIQEFEKFSHEPIRIELVHRASLRKLNTVRIYWERTHKKLLNFLYQQKKVHDNYAGCIMKVIKTFLRYLVVNRGLPVGDYYTLFRVPKDSFNPVIISPEQLKFLITETAFEESLSPVLRRTKDLFVFGCTAGLRYQDLINLKRTNLQSDGTAYTLLLHTKKTGTEVSIPLPYYAVDVLKRLKKRTGRYLLPRVAGSNFNTQLKKLIRAAGWVNFHPKYRQQRGEKVEIRTKNGETYRFYDHISAHTMRRTAITTLLTLGADENTVRRISGHAPGSKEFYRYVVLSQDHINKKVLAAHARLLTGENE